MRLIYEPVPEMYSIESLECWYYHAERAQHFYDRNWEWADWAMIMAIVGAWLAGGIWALEKWALR